MKLLSVFAAVLALAGCVNGKILGADDPHDGKASLLIPHHLLVNSIRPLYGNGEVWKGIPEAGVWLTEGPYLIEEGCFFFQEGGAGSIRVYIKAGRQYSLTCDKKDTWKMIFRDEGLLKN